MFMKIIVGLGNPGLRYRKTRHNVGFSVVKTLAKKHGIGIKKKGFSGIYGIGRISGFEVMLFEPMTYMNLSGEAVKAVCTAKLENRRDLLVISDDANLPLGQIRVRQKGSAGGHNGLRSVISYIGEDFSRLRIGVTSSDTEVKGEMSSFVLSGFPRREQTIIKDALIKAAECAETWLDRDIEAVMGLYNKTGNNT